MEINKIEELAKELMNAHMPELVKLGWKFKLDNARLRFGFCLYRRRTISVSRYIASINEEKYVKQTIIHEIAHALVGSGNGHNAKWKDMAKSLGHNGSRTYSHAVVVPPKKWTIRCPKCGIAELRIRKTERRFACKWCCDTYNKGKFSPEFVLMWERNN